MRTHTILEPERGDLVTLILNGRPLEVEVAHTAVYPRRAEQLFYYHRGLAQCIGWTSDIISWRANPAARSSPTPAHEIPCDDPACATCDFHARERAADAAEALYGERLREGAEVKP